MKIESEKRWMDVHKAELSGSKFDDVNLSGSGWRVRDVHLASVRVYKANLAGAAILSVRLDSATIDGIAVTDPLAYWRAGHGMKSA
jgi:uncharacterized protein YjbI with pentapeptide repeats